MYYKRHDDPDEHLLVRCTVTKVQHHSVFVNVDDYNYSGMIHISEIAPGRIRNIRDYVKEDKIVICKVLRVNRIKKQVDLSLRRVTDMQRREKINEMKHEQRAESIVEYIAKQMKIPAKDLYNQISPKVFKNYNFLFECFEDVVEKNASLQSFGIEPEIAKKFEDVIRQRIKPKEVTIKGKMKLESYNSDGVEIIKAALIEANAPKEIDITYLGGGKYQLIVTTKEYKEAETILKNAVSIIEHHMTQHKGRMEFSRSDK